MRWLVLLGFTLTNLLAHADTWAPPEDPDPQAILREAQADFRAKRYDVALAKHVWFHENALEIRPSLLGVRLSFALSYWKKLADVYPPALVKLEEFRDSAATSVLEEKETRKMFNDMTAINRTLGTETRTAEIFEMLDSVDSDTAKTVFSLARPSLIRGKSYRLLTKYIDPEADFKRISTRFAREKRSAEKPGVAQRHFDFSKKKFANEAATLVALLAIDGRKELASKFAESARKQFDNREFHESLNESLQGVIPEPWP